MEKFGKFSHMLKPGLATVGFDCCGACVSFRSITSRTEQNMVSVSTKTKDGWTIGTMGMVAFQSSDPKLVTNL